MNQNNQQPGSADLPPLPKPDGVLGHEGNGYGQSDWIEAHTPAWERSSVETAMRDAIAASRRASSLPDVAMPAHLREFVKAVAENYTGMDNQERLLCYGCDADLDDHEDHKPDCIVLRAKILLAAQPSEGSAQVAKADYGDYVKWCAAAKQTPMSFSKWQLHATPSAVVRAAPAENEKEAKKTTHPVEKFAANRWRNP